MLFVLRRRYYFPRFTLHPLRGMIRGHGVYGVREFAFG